MNVPCDFHSIAMLLIIDWCFRSEEKQIKGGSEGDQNKLLIGWEDNINMFWQRW